MQIFSKLFIDAASYIEESEYWTYLILYLFKGDRFYLVGFANTYDFFLEFARKRRRISQFVILPPFQRRGHGNQLIKILYETAKADPQCTEITVEEPAPEFQLMRLNYEVQVVLNEIGHILFRDLQSGLVSSVVDYEKLRIPRSLIEEVRKHEKICMEELYRVFELIKYALIDRSKEEIVHNFKKDLYHRMTRTTFIDYNQVIKCRQIYVKGEKSLHFSLIRSRSRRRDIMQADGFTSDEACKFDRS
eukprot:TRINITY_DN1691_c0_g1_i8.p1 TRINITY_DN1691_c0_g1~~TRINITY_DN1691_c0_g1_i8.p1  ORF type:complete len:247 (+),score=46.04 TRINITY_DN1691_c0_g1_i8:693-1433(+)